MKTIEIDFDIHRLIEIERRGFDEPENDALRRLLKLPAREHQVGDIVPQPARASGAKASNGWNWKGVNLPEGTQLRMEYAGQVVEGEISSGMFRIEGKSYRSPSDAAGSSVLTKDGTRPSLNGWMYWEVKRPKDAAWRKLETLKQK